MGQILVRGSLGTVTVIDADARSRWHLVFAQYQEALDELPSVLDDPEAYIAKWREIQHCAAKLEELMPTTTDPLPPYPTE